MKNNDCVQSGLENEKERKLFKCTQSRATTTSIVLELIGTIRVLGVIDDEYFKDY
jgi:hypothetical protein